MKPHKGIMQYYRIHQVCDPTDEHLGYYVTGMFDGHERFHGRAGHTSLVVKREGMEIETLNSRYTLGSPSNYEQEAQGEALPGRAT